VEGEDGGSEREKELELTLLWKERTEEVNDRKNWS